MTIYTSYNESTNGATGPNVVPELAETSTFTGYVNNNGKDSSYYYIPVNANDKITFTFSGTVEFTEISLYFSTNLSDLQYIQEGLGVGGGYIGDFGNEYNLEQIQPTTLGTWTATSGAGYIFLQVYTEDSVTQTFQMTMKGTGSSPPPPPPPPPPSTPDLVFTAFSLSASSVTGGGTINIHETLKNEGKGAAAASNIDIYYSTSATFNKSTATYGGQISVPAIAAGGTYPEVIVDPNINLAGGQYYVFLYETEDGAVTKGAPLKVITPTPDLTVSKFTATPSTILSTDTSDASYSLSFANNGNATATHTDIGIYLSTDSKITTSDTLLSNFDAGAATVGATGGIDGSGDNSFHAALESVASGTYYLGAIVNYNNAVGDSNSANNTSNAVQITVVNPDSLPAAPASTLPDDAQWTASLNDSDPSDIDDKYTSADYDKDSDTDGYDSSDGEELSLQHGLKGLMQSMYNDMTSNIYRELKTLAKSSIAAYDLAQDLYNSAKRATGIATDLHKLWDTVFAPLDDIASNSLDPDSPNFDGNAYYKSITTNEATLLKDAEKDLPKTGTALDDTVDNLIDEPVTEIEQENGTGKVSIKQWFSTNVLPLIAGDSGTQDDDFGGDGNDTITGDNSDFLYGGRGNDTLTAGTGNTLLIGGAGDDVLTGGSGNDRLWGNDGNDTIDGGAGNNYIDGGVGTDTLTYAGQAAGVFVNMVSGLAVNGSGGVDAFLNIENVVGTTSNDTFVLGAASQAIGGNGGTDTFVYSTAAKAVTITDFTAGAGAGHDIIDLTAFPKILTFANVLADAKQSGANTIITLGSGKTITLNNVTLGNLTAANFSLTGPFWASHVSGNWTDAVNWSSNSTPGATDNPVINATGTYTVTSGSNVTVNSVTMTKAATLALTNNSSFAATQGSDTGAFSGNIIVGDGAKLQLGGAVNNAGHINLNSNGSITIFDILHGAILSGAGSIVLSDSSHNLIEDAGSGTLINTSNLITGAGSIGDSAFVLDNQAKGVINGSGVNNALTLNTGTNSILNQGVLEGTTAEGLAIKSAVSNSSTGVIEASGTNAQVHLSDVTISGGTLKTIGTNAAIDTFGTQNASMLDGSVPGNPVNLAGNLVVLDATTLELMGAINNTGVIKLIAADNNNNGHVIGIAFPTDLEIVGDSTLTGGGQIVMAGDGATISTAGTDITLTNGNTSTANTVTGHGTIGDSHLTFVNAAKGVINASDASGGVLHIDSFSFSNAGLLEATGHGVLEFDVNVTDTATGLVKDAAAGANIHLAGVEIDGGTFSTVAGSFLDGTSGASTINTTKAISNAGTLEADGGNLTVNGAVNNTGTLAADNGSHLDLAGAVTGKGSATIANNAIIEFGGPSSANVTFSDGSGTLQLDAATSTAFKFTGTITGFAAGADIDLGAIAYTTGNAELMKFVENSAHTSGVLTVSDGAHTETLAFMGDYTLASFMTQQDANHHVDLLHA